MRIRTYEKPILVVILLFSLALLVLLPVAGGEARLEAEADRRASTKPEATPRSKAAAAQDADLRRDDGRKPPGLPTACAPQERVLTSHSRLAAVAADAAGRMDFYGLPDPETGLRDDDSHDYLRPCTSAELAIVALNPVRLTVHAPRGDAPRGDTHSRPVVLGADTVAEDSRRENGALLTRYRLPGGLFVTQTLRLVRTQGRFASSEAPDTLRASYAVENPTGRPVRFDLSAVLTPARGPQTREFSGVPYLANHPPREQADGPIGAVGVTSSRVLGRADGGISKELIVPRPGAAAASTAYWRPVGAPPDRMAFGPAGELAQGSSLPDSPGEALPDSSAFAALWDGVEAAPGDSATISYEFGPTSGWPG